MKDKIISILEEIRPENDYTMSDDFIGDAFLDSFDIITLVSMLEEEFDIVVDGLDVIPDNFCNIDSIVELVEKTKEGK